MIKTYRNRLKKSISNYLSFSIHCGIKTKRNEYTTLLEKKGFIHEQNSSTVVLIDIPSGYAPFFLANTTSQQKTIIHTWNCCPEYCDDIWDMRPTILLAGTGTMKEIPRAIEDIGRGFTYRITPSDPSILLPQERRILNLLAYNYTLIQIAHQVSLTPQTIKNKLTTIYQKLDLENGKQAILYYWNVWNANYSNAPEFEG